MGSITDMSLTDVRCFAGEQTARLGRITLLLGENSSGKSTFLGCYKALAKLASLVDLAPSNHFDDPPFHMGSFETIVRSDRSHFTLAGRFADHCHSGAQFEFSPGELGTPAESRVQLEFNGRGDETRTLDIEWLHGADALRLTGSSFCLDLPRAEISYLPISTWLSRYVRHGYLPYNGDPSFFSRGQSSSESASGAVEFGKLVSFLRSELPMPSDQSFALEAPDPQLPRRERTYSSPPRYLDIGRDSDLSHLEQVRERLDRAGRMLGLWDAVSLNVLALSGGYQVMVETPSGKRNVVDVGYGIHSLLPLLEPILSADRETVFLLQQPEIHLHPFAQATLAQLMAESNHSFLIETHGDHITDRFRICVMDGTLPPEDLSILYFEKSKDGGNSRIHCIGVDSQANLLDAPTSYRSFFLLETKRLLGFSE